MNKDAIKLYAVYLGGRAPRASIELHDVVFVAGFTLQETYPKLKEKWFGYPTHVPHIDSFIELSYADGFQITLNKEKKTEYKLYFVNFGAYTEHQFGEVHESAFFVAKDKAEATQKARKSLCVGMNQSHLDDHLDVEGLVSYGCYDVDDLIEIDRVDGYLLDFIPAIEKTTPLANPGYIRLKSE